MVSRAWRKKGKELEKPFRGLKSTARDIKPLRSCAAGDCRVPGVRVGIPAKEVISCTGKVARGRATSKGGFRLRRLGMHASSKA